MHSPPPAARVLGTGTALPPHRYEQDALIAAFEAVWSTRHHNARRVGQLHQAVQVGGRNLALPMQDYLGLDFTAANKAFGEVGLEVGAAALSAALDAAGLRPRDLDCLFFTTVTGISAPSLDARLVNRLGLRSDLKRVPIFGLGCVAGAAGLSRVSDYLRGWPGHTAALLSVELCSLTLQREDLSLANLIASGLFGDGAAAVVCGGAAAEHSGSTGGVPEVLATRSVFYPDTEQVMGWDIGASGFKIILSAQVPQVVDQHMRGDVDAFLADQGLSLADIGSVICHSGGPKVLEAFERSLGLSREATALTWRSLREVGNLSSASVLFVLHDTLRERRPAPGTLGLMLAMGPGFCSELLLLRW